MKGRQRLIIFLFSTIYAISSHIANASDSPDIEKEIKKQTELFKAHYSQAKFILKCGIFTEGKFIRFKINKIYKNTGNINKISNKTVLFFKFFKDDMNTTASEAIFIIYPIRKGEYREDIFIIIDGTIIIGDHQIKPELLLTPEKLYKILDGPMRSEKRRVNNTT